MKDIKNKLLDYEGQITEDRLNGRDWPEKAYTMIGLKRLTNIEYCANQVVKDKIEGDFIECGVWRGGACIFMKHLCNELKLDKKIYVADSFCGLPKPDMKYPQDLGDLHYTYDFLKVSQQQVEDNFKQFELLDDSVIFVKGWFCDTLHKIDTKFSVLRVDGDMYSSTMDALNGLYDKLSPGGFIIIDDYALSGCQNAVNDFRKLKQIQEPISMVDWTGAYWRKKL